MLFMIFGVIAIVAAFTNLYRYGVGKDYKFAIVRGHSSSTGSFAFYYPEKNMFFVGDVN